MKSKNQESNILKFKKSRQLNIGIIIFGILFIYLIVTVIMYITAPQITTYEVRKGSILKDYAYTALAIREEVVVQSTDAGYINYFIEDNSKVKVGSFVYTVSTDMIDFDNSLQENNDSLTKQEIKSLASKLQKFNDTFQKSDFSYIYKFKSELQNSVSDYTSVNKVEQLETIINNNLSNNIFKKYSTRDGIFVLSYDGYENITIDNFKLNDLDKIDYKKTEITNNYAINNGDIIYKLVTNEKWHLVLEISQEVADTIADYNVLTVNFKLDNEIVKANYEIQQISGKYILILTMYNSMVRYCNERFLDIELVLDDETGLKIPKSAETYKEFYVIPSDYLTQGGNSNSDGVLVQRTDSDGNSIIQFLPVTVYYEENETVYLDPNSFEENDNILKPNSTETYKLSETKSLQGVYCINKGYTVFKQIKVLCESDEYYIVQEGSDFGLSNYDHIALNADEVQENDVVF